MRLPIVDEMIRASLLMGRVQDALRIWLVAEEGWIPEWYKDSLGYATIGVGHLIEDGDQMPHKLEAVEIVAWLQHDMIQAEAGYGKIFGRLPIDPARQMALTGMVFQLGEDGVRGFRRMCKAIDMHDWEQAAVEALDSRWAAQTPARAKRTAEIIRKGVAGLPKEW